MTYTYGVDVPPRDHQHPSGGGSATIELAPSARPERLSDEDVRKLERTVSTQKGGQPTRPSGSEGHQ